MIVQKVFFSDVFAANCYFYVDAKSRHGFVIDPSAHAEILFKTIQKNDWIIEKILLTHSHLDHIGAALELSRMLNADIFGMKAAEEYLINPNLRGHFTDWNVLRNMRYLNDGDEIVLTGNKDVVLKVFHTSGHTLDSCIFYDAKEKIAFTGDTIFASSVGRTDIEGSGGDEKQLFQSIQTKILRLPEDTILYPGHGEETTVGREKQFFVF